MKIISFLLVLSSLAWTIHCALLPNNEPDYIYQRRQIIPGNGCTRWTRLNDMSPLPKTLIPTIVPGLTQWRGIIDQIVSPKEIRAVEFVGNVYDAGVISLHVSSKTGIGLIKPSTFLVEVVVANNAKKQHPGRYIWQISAAPNSHCVIDTNFKHGQVAGLQLWQPRV